MSYSGSIQPISVPKTHLNIPNVVPQFWDLVEMYLAKSSTLACSLPRAKHAMGLADQDLITMPFVMINKRMSSLRFSSWGSSNASVEAYDVSTVAQQHSCDRSVSHE